MLNIRYRNIQHNDTEHNDKTMCKMRHSALWQNVVMLIVKYTECDIFRITKAFHSECHYTECRYAEPHYAECRNAECRNEVSLY